VQKTRHILLLKNEAETISAHTHRSVEDFANGIVGNKPYTYEMKKPANGKCFFLKNNQCTVYPVRPLICRFYPFELRFDLYRDMHIFDFTLECPTIGKGRIMGRKDFEELYLLAKQRLL